MKGLTRLVLLALLAFAAYNWWKVQSLEQEIAHLKSGSDRPINDSDDPVIAQATSALAQARDALNHANLDRARATFDTARQKLEEAARVANDKAAPTVRWLQEQASRLGSELEDRTHANR